MEYRLGKRIFKARTKLSSRTYTTFSWIKFNRWLNQKWERDKNFIL